MERPGYRHPSRYLHIDRRFPLTITSLRVVLPKYSGRYGEVIHLCATHSKQPLYGGSIHRAVTPKESQQTIGEKTL